MSREPAVSKDANRLPTTPDSNASVPITVVGTSAVTVVPASGPVATSRSEPRPRPTAATAWTGPSRFTSAVT